MSLISGFIKMVQRSRKTIVVTTGTYETLKHMGAVTESFEDVILRLIEQQGSKVQEKSGE